MSSDQVASQAHADTQGGISQPWWRYPIVWMVISGPAAVVVASFITMGIAIKHIDPVLDTSVPQVNEGSRAPAMQARNHAAEAARAPADR